MKKIVALILFLSLVIIVLPLAVRKSMVQAGLEVDLIVEAGPEVEDHGQVVYLVKVSGEIDRGLAPFISRVVQESDEQGVQAVILEINTFGGRLDAAVEIRDALLNAKTLTIAYINERAISAGALISLACQKIAMVPGATIGAATPVTINPFDQTVQTASEKVISYFRKEMKATAEKNHRPPLIAEAMVDPDVVIEGLIEKGKLLTLTTSEALQHGAADFETSEGIEGVLQKLNLWPASVLEKKPNWAEKFLRAVSGSLISSLLLSIGLLGLFLEFKTPTWGIAGTVGLICLAVFFWGHVVLNLVGWEEVILLLAGTVLLMLEVFVIPGFGLTGILGLTALAAGFTLSLLGNSPTAVEIWGAVSQISIVFFIVLVAFALSLKFLTKTSAGQRLVLHARSGVALESGASLKVESVPTLKVESVPTTELKSIPKTTTEPKANWNDYLNREGVAFTNLRPAGKAVFGLQRLNVVSEGDFIEKGSPVRVIRVEGSRIMVQKISQKIREES